MLTSQQLAGWPAGQIVTVGARLARDEIQTVSFFLRKQDSLLQGNIVLGECAKKKPGNRRAFRVLHEQLYLMVISRTRYSPVILRMLG